MINLKTKPHFEKKGVYDKILVDADLIAFSCAAASDGHYYAVRNLDEGIECYRCRYKKELDQYLSDVKFNYEVYDDYEPESLDTCLHSVKMMTSGIIETVGGGEYQLFLTGKGNFRTEVNPEYKANRKDVRRPFHLDSCRKYLVDVFGAEIVNGMEADDLCGINQTENSIICTIDKDLKMVPGWNYHWNKQEITSVSEEEGLQIFYSQVLVGDRTDNIFGVDGIGKVTADKLIKGSGLTSNKDLYDFVVQIYADYENLPCVSFEVFLETVREKVDKVCKQIWILRESGVMWTRPVE